MMGLRVTLPGGYWQGETCWREAELRPICGEDEAYITEYGDKLSAPQFTTTLLSRCLVRLGRFSPVSSEHVRSLSVGDREALLLHLRALTLGEQFESVVACPACKEKMDLELKVGDLLLKPYADPQQRYEVTLAENGICYKVCFRIPNGEDQEALANSGTCDVNAAVGLLLKRCVRSVSRDDDGRSVALTPALAQSLQVSMAEADPQAELVLNLDCPVCGHVFTTLFDTATYVLQELRAHLQRLYKEVHALAFHYHWSEAEILSMTPRKRQRYLGLLADALSEGAYR